MMYQGGKSRIAEPITKILIDAAQDRSTYIEPFLGSAAVFHRVAPSYEIAIGSDVIEDLILMWGAACEGWVPPESLNVTEYEMLRHAEPSALRAFAGFPCSFGGKWFGGYARDPKSSRNFARTASRSIVRRAANMREAILVHADYRALDFAVTSDTVVYCDPPYADTLAYAGARMFDSAMFWETVTRWSERGALVFVSEYVAPDGWTEIWSQERHVSTALDNAGARAVDRLFVRDRP